MKKYISVKAIIGLLILFLMCPIVFFILTTSYSTPTDVAFVSAKPSEVKYSNYNALYVHKSNYEVLLNKQKLRVPDTEIMQFISAHQNDFKAMPLVIFVAADTPFPLITQALDAVVVNELKEYQLVSEK